MKKKLSKSLAFLTAVFCVHQAYAQMEFLSDSALSDVTGQALFVADKIGGISGSNMTFYRMALDGEVGFNMNIDRLQLGCGGFNSGFNFSPHSAQGCDIDLDYVRLTGRGPGQPGAPDAASAPDGANPLTNFVLTRPYLEFAFKNDASGTTREFVGMKIGSASANGYMSIGRFIQPNTGTAGCTSNSSPECHMGINSFSGNFRVRAQGDVNGCVQIIGCWAEGDIGDFDSIANLRGTRMSSIYLMNMPVTVTVVGIDLEIRANMVEKLKYIHGLAINPALPGYSEDDFFLSFQREVTRWPTFNKSQSYSPEANAGWWMNIPGAEMLGLQTPYKTYTLGSLGGVTLTDIDIGQRPIDNCYGNLAFC